MNDRAIELFKQAGTKAYELCKERGYEVSAIDTIWVSMMAATLSELVVNECLMQVVDYVHIGGMKDGTTYFADDKISEHFGVEE